MPPLAVHAIREDRAGNLWVGGSTVVLIHGDCREYHLEGYGSANRVKSISEAADGTIWVGTVSGLQRMPRASRESGRFETHSRISAPSAHCCEDQHRHPLDRHHRRRPAPLRRGSLYPCERAPDNPPSSTVLALFNDNERNIWAGMQTGLLRLSRGRHEHVPFAGYRQCRLSARSTRTRTARCGWPARTSTASTRRRDHSELVPAPAPGIRVRNVMRDSDGRAVDRHRRRRRLPLRKGPAGAVHQTHRTGERFRPRVPREPRRQRLDRHR